MIGLILAAGEKNVCTLDCPEKKNVFDQTFFSQTKTLRLFGTKINTIAV